ncbi:threonine aldolase [Niastella koreensis]|uniref:L-threonine aldolase n=2 Tax=Niastella koreensis TaxID=354356 RepID=G8TJ11_NIAKG|nr:GntG family PLP-dependent aldolase [Niastella koreensis]AEV97528.1 L-threonine aldolase [Niastella koreensis GR20-10]OQP47657.1 threonine aldolase [Niastella koreensis]
MIVDLRSDTVTQPTPEMMDAMLRAHVGDDVFGEDATVNLLETMAAELFGMEAALYCPTGTMSNQIAIKVHTQPGDEVICDQTAHVYQYEGGGMAFNSGVQSRLLPGNRGRVTADQVAAAINPDDVHKAHTSLVCLENTSNRGGGSCYDLAEIQHIRTVCDTNNLSLHLDGARLFNAIVARNESPKQYGELFHSISVCLNKGLGCPIGSILIGSQAFIKKARRARKVFGGGMRQAGYMAACGVYALKNNIIRLQQDHENAREIASNLIKTTFTAGLLPVETNIIIFEIQPPFQAAQVAAALKEKNILAIAISPTQIRMVLHLGITPAMVQYVVDTVLNLQL